MTDSFICPDCGMKSYNENDVRFRYCGNCHEFKDESRYLDTKGEEDEPYVWRAENREREAL